MLSLTLVKSREPWLNRRALTMLGKLSNVTITIKPFDNIVNEHFELPFIETQDGRRAYGLAGIKRFIENIQHLNS